VLAIGAPGYSQDGVTYRGLVRVFRFSGSSWSSPANIVGTATDYDQFGYSVDLSSDGNVLAVGVKGYDQDGVENRGLVRVFRFGEGSWSSPTDLIGIAAYAEFGFSVALSSDGNVLAVGAPYYSQDGVKYWGLVRVFRFSGSSWSSPTDFVGVESIDTSYGFSIALSSDGNVLAVGAPGNDKDCLANRGLVQVLRFT